MEGGKIRAVLEARGSPVISRCVAQNLQMFFLPIYHRHHRNSKSFPSPIRPLSLISIFSTHYSHTAARRGGTQPANSITFEPRLLVCFRAQITK